MTASSEMAAFTARLDKKHANEKKIGWVAVGVLAVIVMSAAWALLTVMPTSQRKIGGGTVLHGWPRPWWDGGAAPATDIAPLFNEVHSGPTG